MEKKGSRTMRKTWKKLAAMAVTASMVICGGAMGVSAATEEEKPEKVTVNVAYMPDYASLNGLISAIELGYFRETMAGGHGQGKKLGFIAQEMGREINTTGSKSNHAEMQNIVVQMKDELEQIKEQVLNVM